MDSRAQDSNPEQDVLANEVNESLGMPEGEHEIENSYEPEGNEGSEDSGSSKKRPTGWERLKQKNRANEREIRELHARMAEMQSRMPDSQSQHMMNHDDGMGQPAGVDEQIHRAVSYALQHKEMEERKAHQAKQAAHIQKQYEGLHNHLDNMSDKYDDFDDVVRGNDVPITTHMRDAALFLPQEGPGSAGEVLYKLGKNRQELERISNLHPLEQVRELNKLSRSLELGGYKQNSTAPRTLGNIKNNPVGNSHSITDKSSVSEIRKRMKTGWK